jgi:signal transduction histidine kinase
VRPLLLSWIALSAAACTAKAQEILPRAEKGILRLVVPLQSSGVVNLDGDWEFYREKYLNPGDWAKVQSSFIEVPGIWNDHPDVKNTLSKSHPGYGFATYRLRVVTGHSTAALALLMPAVSTAYRLFVNGTLVLTVGTPGTTQANTRPMFHAQVVRLAPALDSYELIFHVANFSHRDGGIWNSILLGTDAAIEKIRVKNLFGDFFLAGAIFIMGLYHIMLYLLRRKDKSPLGFGVFCILIAAHIFCISEFTVFIFFPKLPWEAGTRFVYIIWPLAALTFSYYATRIFPLGGFKVPYQITKIVLVLFVPLFALLPFEHITYADWALEGVTGGIMLIGVYLVIRAIPKQRVDAFVYFGAFILFVLCYVNDALYTNHIIYQTTTLMPAGLMLFLLAQSFLLSKRSAAAYEQLEELSESLEKKVVSRTAELQEANALKDKFVALISHDLRSPISGMRQILKILSGMDVSKQKAEFADLVGVGEKSMATLMGMIEQVLDLTRISGGKIQPLWEKADLAELVRAAAEKISLQARSKGVTLDIRLAQPILSHTDATLFAQSVQNIVHNAVKFCNHGDSITIDYKLRGDYHSFKIIDTGSGIDAELLPDLFKANVKTSTTGTGGELGNGLGLPLSCEMIAALRGKITVTSEIGKGTCFTVSLPQRNA